MSVQYSMFGRTSLASTPNYTCSAGLAPGPTPSEAPDGPTTDPSSPSPARASLSARQAQAADLLTSGTSGPQPSTSSSSSDLARSLVSKLRAKLASRGSTLFSLTWRERVTPAQRSIYRLAASAHRTSGSGCGSWPTPALTDMKGGYTGGRIRNGQLSTDRLDVTAQLTGPTPSGSPAGTGSGAPRAEASTPSFRLNPALPRWLMNLPPLWDIAAIAAHRKLKRQKHQKG